MNKVSEAMKNLIKNKVETTQYNLSVILDLILIDAGGEFLVKDGTLFHLEQRGLIQKEDQWVLTDTAIQLLTKFLQS